MDRKIKKLVIDSGALIRNIPLWEYGEKFYCVDDVIREIKDRQAKQHVNSLPIQLIFKEPSSSSIKFINDFTKKTGDFASLSLADVKVLALTYELEVEAKGNSRHLRTEPASQRVEQITSIKPPDSICTPVEGFYLPSNKKSTCETADVITDKLEKLDMVSENIEGTNSDDHCVPLNEENGIHSHDSFEFQETKINEEDEFNVEGSLANEELIEEENYERPEINEENREELEEEEEEVLEDEDEVEEDDDEGWITPSNIKSINKKKDSLAEEDLKDVEVACITGDFSMQNTLKHIGLHVLGVNGSLIKSVRTFILRCHACFRTTNRMEKIFCPYCGNKTLKRVSVTLNPDGTQKIWISAKKPINIRGTKYSLPTPKGGKHSINPILVADQREAQRRVTKLGRIKNDPMHEDYDARAEISPFATRDVYSRSAQLGIKSGKTNHRGVYYWELKNPNVPMKTSNVKRKR